MKKNIFLSIISILLLSCSGDDHNIDNNTDFNEKSTRALSIDGPAVLFSDGDGLYTAGRQGIRTAEILNTEKVKYYPIGGSHVGSYPHTMYIDLRSLNPGTATLKFTMSNGEVLTKNIDIINSTLTGRCYKQKTQQWTNLNQSNMSHYIETNGENDYYTIEVSHSDPNAIYKWYSLDMDEYINRYDNGKKVVIRHESNSWNTSDAYLLRVTTNGGIFKRLFTFGKPTSMYENQPFPFEIPEEIPDTYIVSPEKLYPGSKFQFTLANGNQAVWSASTTTYMTIDPSTGLFTNHNPDYQGNIKITATTESGKSYTKNIMIEGSYMDGAYWTGSTQNIFSQRFAVWPIYNIGYNYSNINQPSKIEIFNPPGRCKWTLMEKVLPLDSWSEGCSYFVKAFNGGRAKILLEIETDYGIMEQLFNVN